MNDRLLVVAATKEQCHIPRASVRYVAITPLVDERIRLDPRFSAQGVQIGIWYELSRPRSGMLRKKYHPDGVALIQGGILTFDEILAWHELESILQGYVVSLVEILRPKAFSPFHALQRLLTERVEGFVATLVDGDILEIEFTLKFTFRRELRKRVPLVTWIDVFGLPS